MAVGEDPNIRAFSRALSYARDQTWGPSDSVSKKKQEQPSGRQNMAEGVRTPPNGGGLRFKVRAPREFYGGLSLIGVAIVAIWASGELPGMHGFAFGPGTAP